MIDSAISRSPIHADLDARGAEWCSIDGISFALRIQDEDIEQAAMTSLAICDLSGLRKVGLKGPDAERSLAAEEIDVPQSIFESHPLLNGGFVVRFGKNEFFLEDGVGNSVVEPLVDRVTSNDMQVFRVEHQEATFLLTGSRSCEVLAQTCGINFSESALRRVIFTRVAGVSCGVFPDIVQNIQAYRIWVDPSYAVYLWETLAEICESLGGKVTGIGRIYSSMTS